MHELEKLQGMVQLTSPWPATSLSAMRPTLFSLLFLTLVSCGPAAVLYVDDVFRTAAPEVVEAWQGLAPWKDARLRLIPPGAPSAAAAMEADLQTQGSQGPGSVLVGAMLSPQERQTIETRFPARHFHYLSPDAGDEAITVNVDEAYEMVARSAAVPGEAATALFSAEAPERSREAFSHAWEAAGGGPLTVWVWPPVGTLKISGQTVFQWVGPEADSLVTNLSPRIKVHGNPGTARAPGATGFSWRLRTAGLGDFLWLSAQSLQKKAHWLPLETYLVSR